MRIIYEDKKEKVLVRCEEGRVMDLIFYDSPLHNIYRAKVVNKIDSLNAYFVQISDTENLFLKSTLSYKIGDNAIVEYVREPTNGKLGLASENFKIENEAYILTRYPLRGKPKLKKNKGKDGGLYRQIILDKENLIKEENFLPTPKLLVENKLRDTYLSDFKDYEIREFEIKNSSIIKELIENISDSEIFYKDLSIIIDELKTLTVIDINTGSRKSKNKKKDFLLNVNLELIDFITYNLKLRNIGGMVIIDFLRSDGEKKIIEEFQKACDKYKLEAEIFGFTKMGLFEMTIKRRGNSLKAKLSEKNLLP